MVEGAAMTVGTWVIPAYIDRQLTVTQANYLRFIVLYALDHNGNSPTKAELAQEFNVKWSTTRWHLHELSNKRLIRIEDGKIIVEDSIWEPPNIVTE
jgi:Mn-dependent DtxR family transcriptional regulator